VVVFLISTSSYADGGQKIKFSCLVESTHSDLTNKASDRLVFEFAPELQELCQDATHAKLQLCFSPKIGNVALLTHKQKPWDSSSNISFGTAREIPSTFQLNILDTKASVAQTYLAHCKKI
jgi:hypothetical protein